MKIELIKHLSCLLLEGSRTPRLGRRHFFKLAIAKYPAFHPNLTFTANVLVLSVLVEIEFPFSAAASSVKTPNPCKHVPA